MSFFFKEFKLDYVLIYARTTLGSKTLFVLKDRPNWQKGRLNLPGGKIEDGESPEQAALRELKEESGLEGYKPELMGKIFGNSNIVYCISVTVDNSALKPNDGETEKIFWENWHMVANNKILIPNLRVIVPMMATGVKGWSIYDSENKGCFEIDMNLPDKTSTDFLETRWQSLF